MTVVFSTLYKGRSRAPRLRSQPGDSEAQQVPDEPQRTQGSRIWKLPLASRHAFYKGRGTKCICHSSVLGQFPKALCALPGGGSRPPPGTKAGDSPGFRLVPLSLAADCPLKIPTKPFPLRLCPKCSAHHSVALEPDPPLHYSTGHSSREWLYSNSWETERKSNGWPDMHHLLHSFLVQGPALLLDVGVRL